MFLSCPYTIYSPISSPSLCKWFLLTLPWPKYSNDVLRFEIAWWEVSQKVEQIDRRTQIDQWWILHPCPFVFLSCPYTIYSPISGPSTVQIVLKPLPWSKNSNDVLRFEIAWWEVGQKVEQTDRWTQIDQGVNSSPMSVCVSVMSVHYLLPHFSSYFKSKHWFGLLGPSRR